MKSSSAGTFSQRMDPTTACVPWQSPPPIPSRQNMPRSIDLEQSVIYSDLYTLDEHNIRKSVKGKAFGTRIQIKEVPIPQLYQKALHKVPSSPVAKGMRAVVVSSARWDASNQGPRSQRSGATSDQQYAFNQQVNHLQENRKAIDQCKTLKEIARIVPHRVDRLYYICGSHIPIRPKYEVDMTALKRLQMKRSSQEAATAQEGRKGWVYEETEENESISSFEAQVVDPEMQDNPNNKCCPCVTPVFMTENMEESQEVVQGKIQQSDGESLGSVEEDEKTVEHLSTLGEESPAAAMSPECLNQGPRNGKR
ncbi:uncharacterized protein LOC119971301 [Scyliorhinus canicula]|uniref:uncharacterized protein LOC119971301 n=1 Tax=Scyliorhinus canicula TaxID=7830 RepID=UPI0018F762B4|nr:uncharacterized protein LOC119971301 [Scyliorhinus canicula]